VTTIRIGAPIAYGALVTEHRGDERPADACRGCPGGWARIRAWAGRLGRSFGFATRGIWVARSGANFKIQVAAAGVVVLLAVAYGITGSRLGLVVLSITAVISAEIVNTAVERVCDLVAELHGLGRDPRIKDIKDLAAAAVLVVAVGAAVNGIIAFGPQLT
jgi:diacylglycerol kinase